MKKLIHSANLGGLVMVAAFIWLGLLPEARAVVPAPDGGYPNGNTAEGDNALLSLNTGVGVFNTAVGWYSLKTDVEGGYNTAVGAGALFANSSGSNTAVGAGALLLNTGGTANTATGALALIHNETGGFNTSNGAQSLFYNTLGHDNTADGYQALMNNTSGNFNTAVGDQALFGNTAGNANTAIGAGVLSNNTTAVGNTAIGNGALGSNTDGNLNTAVGQNALASNTFGNNNIALGRLAGSGVTNASNVICIGAAGQNLNNSCFISNIAGTGLDRNNATPVYIDLTTGQLGTVLVDAPGNKTTGPVPQVGHGQALLNEFLKEHRKVEEQEATIAALKKEVASLAATVKEQAAQIQKVSARIELNKAEPRTVLNNP